VLVAVEVGLLHLDRPFAYRLPAGLDAPPPVGTRVKVPFGGRRVGAFVLGPAPALPPDARELERVVSAVPAFGERELALARWVADRYAGSLADTLRLALPPRVAAVERAMATEVAEAAGAPAAAGERPAPAAGAPTPGADGPGADGPGADGPGADGPGADGPGAGGGAPAGGAAGARGPGVPLALRPGEVAWWRPLPGEDRGERIADLVEAVVAQGLGAIVLAPEVAAGSPVAQAVRARFGDVADLSGASDRARYRAWLALARGRCRVALGGRSAVFAPVERLGLVVVDDEASHLLKEQRSPRYHARAVALRRALTEHAACLLVGTVPSAEAVAALGTPRGQAGGRRARAGGAARPAGTRMRLLAPDRARERRLAPLVEVVDPDDEGPAGPRLHPRGLRVIREALARGESAYVLVPRRGPAARPGAPARTAGQVAAELTLALGSGPAVWRLDREVVEAGAAPPWTARGAGVVVGTVAGIKDRPPIAGCRTVVVVGADAALAQAEVRATEDALRTWWRAALWCGPRGGGGRMVLQTRSGGHHAVQALVRFDADHFWRHELPRRTETGFPPARALILVEGPEPDQADEALRVVAGALGRRAELLGPAGMGRGWRIIAKVDDAAAAALALRPVLAGAARSGRPRLAVDVDPLEVLAAARAAGS
jgi:primosomal protein N' (replication factor Y)